jgi:hypothetical protein
MLTSAKIIGCQTASLKGLHITGREVANAPAVGEQAALHRDGSSLSTIQSVKEV